MLLLLTNKKLRNLIIVCNYRICFYSGCFYGIVFFEELILKNKDGDYTNGNGCISNIENGTKKFKVITAPNRNPFWKMCVGYNGKIKHVYHFAMKERAVMRASKGFGHYPIKLRMGFIVTAIENKAVEHTI